MKTLWDEMASDINPYGDGWKLVSYEAARRAREKLDPIGTTMPFTEVLLTSVQR